MSSKIGYAVFIALATCVSAAASAQQGVAPESIGPPTQPSPLTPLPEPGVFSSSTANESWPSAPIGAIDGEIWQPRFWTSAEFLLWWMKPVCQKAPLLNAGSPTDPLPGADGQANTVPIFTAAGRYNMPGTPGFRLGIGGWFEDNPRLGWDAYGFWVARTENRAINFASADGSPFTYLPYTDQNNASQAIPFTVPGQVAGSITAVGSSQLWGADTNLIYRFIEDRPGGPNAASLLFGFRNLNLHDQVNITQTQTLLADPTQFAVGNANFQTHSHFFGAQVGARFEKQFGGLLLSATGKFAPGEVRLIADVAGDPFLAGPQVLGGSVPGPLLAFPSNVGSASTWNIAFVNEINLRARYVVTRHVQLTLGYNLIYLNRISCPGDNMPQIVNVTQVPALGPQTGKVLPPPALNKTDYFAHGLISGLEVVF